MFKKVISLILICCLLLISCGGNVRKGALIKTEYEPDYSKLVQYNYYFELSGQHPTLDDPRLGIKIHKAPLCNSFANYQFQKIRQYKTTEQEGKKFWIGSLLLAAGIAGFFAADKAKKAEEKKLAEEGRSDNSLSTGLNALSAVACGMGLVCWIAIAIPTKVVSESVVGVIEESEPIDRLSEGDLEPVSRIDARFAFATPRGDKIGRECKIISNSNGYATIDLLKEAGIYEVPFNVDYIIISSPKMENTIGIKCSDWLDPILEITANEMNVRSGPGTDYQIVGKAFRGESFLEIDSRDNWAKISFESGEAWIYKNLTKKRYAKYRQPYPPELRASLTFREPNGNNVLDAEETAQIKLNLENRGKGIAFGTKIKVSIEEDVPGLQFKEEYDVGQLSPSQDTLITIPFKADISIPSKQVYATITVSERNGFGLPSPLGIRFSTQEFQPPDFELVDYGIEDFNHNKKVEPLEMVTVTARIQNRGNGTAKDVRANLSLGANVFWGGDSPSSFYLGTISPGDFRDIDFTVYTNNQATSVPITLTISESYGKYGKTENLDLPFNAVQKTTEELTIPAITTPIYPSSPPPLTADVDVNIPRGTALNSNGIAVIIANQNYKSRDIRPVQFAYNDAAIMKEYLLNQFGYLDGNIIFIKDASYADFNRIFGSATNPHGKLNSYVRPGISDVFVYYSGHGAPDPSSKKGYFLPADCCPEDIAINGYSLDLFYENLSKLEARSLTIAIDACFSGGSSSGMLLTKASPVYIDISSPLTVDKNAIVLTSSAGNEISSWYPAKKHGLFTYFFLKGLGGEADSNEDKVLTGKEIFDYLSDKTNGVPYWARRLYNGRVQTPSITGDEQKIIARLK